MVTRYVLAVILSVAIVGIAMPAVDEAAADRSQSQVQTQVVKIKTAATSLVEHEEVGLKSESGGRRIVTVEFPRDSLTSKSVQYVRFNPKHALGFTTVTYEVKGHSPERTEIDAVIVSPDNESVEMGKADQETIILTLKRDGSGDRVVVLERK